MIRVAPFILCVTSLLCFPLSTSQAEANSVERYVSQLVLGGISPAPELCAEQRWYLGEVDQSGDLQVVDDAIAAQCRALTNPRTGRAPFVIRGCFLLHPSDDELFYDPSRQSDCYCDLFFCDEQNLQSFEEGITSLFKLSRLFR